MRRTPTLVLTATLVAILALGGCSSSDDAAPKATTTTEATTTTSAEETTTTASEATEPSEGSGLPSCDEVLRQYTEAFTPDQLQPVVDLFRSWAPSMPDDVAAAVTRIADAYEEAGNLGELDMANQDLSADAQTFSDWTADGCPAA